MTMPAWLPPTINVAFHSDIEWKKITLRLYQLFRHDFIDNKCYLQSSMIITDTRKINSPYEEGFWHVVEKEERGNAERTFDIERASRLPWCRPVIENASDDAVICWYYLEDNNKTRTYLWLQRFDYLIVLEKKKHIYFLVTAFYVEGDRTRKSLRNKYDKRVV